MTKEDVEKWLERGDEKLKCPSCHKETDDLKLYDGCMFIGWQCPDCYYDRAMEE